ncbi:MAG: hypothetical protein LIP11_16715 [Clostridiales bacterium]|nr:hypothetical protein [Clostridiales bacterium]
MNGREDRQIRDRLFRTQLIYDADTVQINSEMDHGTEYLKAEQRIVSMSVVSVSVYKDVGMNASITQRTKTAG